MNRNISPEWNKLLFTPDLLKELNIIKIKILEITPPEKLCPPIEKWFEWARITELDSINTICIGQDPYPRRSDAHGLSFSSLSKKIPPSLQNIFKCLKTHNLLNPGKIYKENLRSNLTSWGKQGVLMLNVGLSTEVKTPRKHLKLWKPYTVKLIAKISEYGKLRGKTYNFMLWGNFAQNLQKYINGDHNILTWRHPSPMANSRVQEIDKFYNCDHFTLVNQNLVSRGEQPIHWDPRHKVEEQLLDLTLLKMIREIKINYDCGKSISLLTHQVFTDGSCWPNNKRAKQARAGYACIFVNGPWRNKLIYGNLSTSNGAPVSNIRAEGIIIIRILEELLQDMESNCPTNWKTCQIFTDSEFWIKMVKKYMPKWSTQDFKNKKNPDLTKRLWKLWICIMGREKDLEFIHVYSHNKNGWKNSAKLYEKFCYDNNSIADTFAGYARVSVKIGVEIMKFV